MYFTCNFRRFVSRRYIRACLLGLIRQISIKACIKRVFDTNPQELELSALKTRFISKNILAGPRLESRFRLKRHEPSSENTTHTYICTQRSTRCRGARLLPRRAVSAHPSPACPARRASTRSRRPRRPPTPTRRPPARPTNRRRRRRRARGRRRASERGRPSRARQSRDDWRASLVSTSSRRREH